MATDVIQIDAKLSWRAFRDDSANRWVAVCDPLGLTAEADSWIKLFGTIDRMLNFLMDDLLRTGEFDSFMRDQGWSLRPGSRLPNDDDHSYASAEIPHFLSFKSLKPYVDKHLGRLQSVIVKYRTEKGAIAHGIEAKIIPSICEVWLDADDEIKLDSRQKQIAQKAKILMRGLTHVGRPIKYNQDTKITFDPTEQGDKMEIGTHGPYPIWQVFSFSYQRARGVRR